MILSSVFCWGLSYSIIDQMFKLPEVHAIGACLTSFQIEAFVGNVS